jgi:hypothetical protein
MAYHRRRTWLYADRIGGIFLPPQTANYRSKLLPVKQFKPARSIADRRIRRPARSQAIQGTLYAAITTVPKPVL